MNNVLSRISTEKGNILFSNVAPSLSEANIWVDINTDPFTWKEWRKGKWMPLSTEVMAFEEPPNDGNTYGRQGTAGGGQWVQVTGGVSGDFVPLTRTVNGLSLSANINIAPANMTFSGVSLDNWLLNHNHSTGNGGVISWSSITGIPTASTSLAGIIQIGSNANQAAAGNHTHTLGISDITGLQTALNTIPTVYNPTITINQGGVPKGSFTLNQSGPATINLDSGGPGVGMENHPLIGGYHTVSGLTAGHILQATGATSYTFGSIPIHEHSVEDITGDIPGAYSTLLEWVVDVNTAINNIVTPVQSNWTEGNTASLAYIQNKPSIPVVNNSTISIYQDGITKGTFQLNQNTNANINLDITANEVQMGGANFTVTNSIGSVPLNRVISSTDDLYSLLKEMLTAPAPTGYTVTFNTNGGNSISSMPNTTELNSGNMPANPTRTGNYSFDNWYTNSGLSSLLVLPYPINAPTTIYAKWNNTGFDVSFNTDGGSAVVQSTNVVIINTSPSTNKSGYEFRGWFTSPANPNDYVNNKVSFPYTVSNNQTLYAKWEEDLSGPYEWETPPFVYAAGTRVLEAGNLATLVPNLGTTYGVTDQDFFDDKIVMLSSDTDNAALNFNPGKIVPSHNVTELPQEGFFGAWWLSIEGPRFWIEFIKGAPQNIALKIVKLK